MCHPAQGPLLCPHPPSHGLVPAAGTNWRTAPAATPLVGICRALHCWEECGQLFCTTRRSAGRRLHRRLASSPSSNQMMLDYRISGCNLSISHLTSSGIVASNGYHDHRRRKMI